MPSDFDSEQPTVQPATLDQPFLSADDSAPAEAQTPASVTLDAAPDPLPEWLILLLRHNAPLMRFGH
ncbi:MAG TPA: hypothetical protein VF725_11545 [Ktedonobacterales bacterium]